MAGDDKIQFDLDLDSSAFMSKMKDAGLEIAKLAGKDKDIEKLVGQFKTLAVVGGTVAAAYYGVKVAIGTIIEAEEIRGVTRQFEILAEQAGIAGDALKEGLGAAAGGLIDDTDLLKLANQSITAMGESASKLPEIMTLARKATATFGGDLEQNFEKISQAIATGNTRTLKQIGITVDADKALTEYAKTQGVLKSELTEVGKKHAIMNEILEKGSRQFKNVDENANKTKDTLTRTKVALQQIGEVLTLAFERAFGDQIRSLTASLEDFAKKLKTTFTSNLGEGAEKSAAQLQQLEDRLAAIRNGLAQNEKLGGKFYDSMMLDRMNKEATELQDKISKLQGSTAGEDGIPTMGRGGGRANKPLAESTKDAGTVDQSAVVRREAAEELALYQAKMKVAEAQVVNAKNDEEREAALVRFKDLHDVLIAKQFADLDQKALTEPQKAAEIEQQKLLILQNSLAQQALMENSLQELRQKNADQSLAATKTFGDGLAGQFKATGVKAQGELRNMSTAGKAAANSLQNGMFSALESIGSGTKSVTEAVKGMFFGMIGDISVAQGRNMILSAFSTFPVVKVPQLVAGGALVALGGFLKSKAGGSGGASIPDTGGAAGGGGGSSLAQPESGFEPTVQQAEQKRKSVTIQIQGNYFETEQTKTRLLEMVRESTDATDFKYQQIGSN